MIIIIIIINIMYGIDDSWWWNARLASCLSSPKEGFCVWWGNWIGIISIWPDYTGSSTISTIQDM